MMLQPRHSDAGLVIIGVEQEGIIGASSEANNNVIVADGDLSRFRAG
ncbi:MAG: hypothetical protein OXC63_05430 [Aestuariivita sp.]|nr:hypothetical protein [Aestuariivita sp.]